jgi:type II secretory pathway pseudopilin PulG
MERRAQIWIETVLYTLIGLALIGMVLAFIIPKINETKDRLAVDQTIEALNDLASKMEVIPGNVRQVDFTMKRGEMTINSPNNEIVFVFDDITTPLSQVGQEIPRGKIIMLTGKGQKYYNVSLTLDLNNSVDLRYRNSENKFRFVASPNPYKIEIRSLSPDGQSNGRQIISIDSIS